MPPSGDPAQFTVRIFGKNSAATRYNGTGIVINADGLVLTCWHVVEKAEEIWIKFPFEEPLLYKIDQKREQDDVALLRGYVPPGVDMRHAVLASRWLASAKSGESVSVWGYSAAENYIPPQQYVCNISGFSGQFGLVGLHCNINPGDSGGPVTNSSNEVIAIAALRDGKRTGQAMAIPMSLVVDLLSAAQVSYSDAAESNDEQITHPLHIYPVGPTVPRREIPGSIWRAYAEIIPVLRAASVIDQANDYRLEADPDDSEVTLIDHGELPTITISGANVYWEQAFIEAGRNSPRMLAALLSCLKPAQLPVPAQRDRERLLTHLRSMSRKD